MKETVFFVEDEWIQRTEITKAFKKQGYVILDYGNITDAHTAAQNGLHYELAIIDRGFERSSMSGDDLMALSKQLHPDVPIVCLSGSGLKAPYADYHFTKPIMPSTLINFLEVYVFGK